MTAMVTCSVVVAGCSTYDGAAEAGGPVNGAAEGASTDPRTHYNVVWAVSDDMDDFACADVAEFLPASAEYWNQGRCFENATTVSPVCSPSRGAMFMGQYPHTSGLETQSDQDQLDVDITIQAELDAAGVHTYGTGKFLNGVSPKELADPDYQTGFTEHDFWKLEDYYAHTLPSKDGELYRPEEQPHITKLTGNFMSDYLEEQLPTGDQFMLYGSFTAPHDRTGIGKGGNAIPTIPNRTRAVPPFEFDPEKNGRDKLLPFHTLEGSKQQLIAKNSARVRAFYDVDEQMERLFEQLQDAGELDNTAVFLVSDNGYSLGENNWMGKATPYPASTDVPLLAYLPEGLAGPGVDERPVDVLDIPATVYDIMDVEPQHELDGHSLLGDYERESRLLEYTNERDFVPLEAQGHAPYYIPTWKMIRRGSVSYVEWYQRGERFERELYTDATMEKNLLGADVPTSQRPDEKLVQDLADELDAYRDCHGTVASGSDQPCP